jgi:hypothetical protein
MCNHYLSASLTVEMQHCPETDSGDATQQRHSGDVTEQKHIVEMQEHRDISSGDATLPRDRQWRCNTT